MNRKEAIQGHWWRNHHPLLIIIVIIILATPGCAPSQAATSGGPRLRRAQRHAWRQYRDVRRIASHGPGCGTSWGEKRRGSRGCDAREGAPADRRTATRYQHLRLADLLRVTAAYRLHNIKYGARISMLLRCCSATTDGTLVVNF